jgi:hypothetical protein
MTLRIGQLALVGVMTLIGGVLPRASYAQNMSFSYYSDATVGSDGGTLYASIDGYDYSTGCTHYDYSTDATLNTPSGSYYSSGGGLSASIDSPTDDGNYSIYSNSTVNCSCFGSGLGAGGGFLGFDIRRTTSYFTSCDPYGVGYCKCTELACSSGTATCDTWAIPFRLAYDSCSPYIQVTWVVLDVRNGHGCVAGYATVSQTPGACT